jgi:predicted enzyme related to lactoylglutathione lyase
MLGKADLMAFVATREPGKAREFYEKVVGLKFVSEDPFAVVFDANGVALRVQNVSNMKEFKAVPFTVLGWRVTDVEAEVRELGKRGAKFEQFEGMGQDELGIWKSPSGARVAWFKDPEGNVLSVMQG